MPQPLDLYPYPQLSYTYLFVSECGLINNDWELPGPCTAHCIGR